MANDGARDGPQLKKEDYTIAWICALPDTEMLASRFSLDQSHETPDGVSTPSGNKYEYQYCFGSMCGHNIVMACLPVEHFGQSTAAAILSAILQTFSSIQMTLMVGVAGGVWNQTNDVRLGDVVISHPSKERQHGGVVRYDYGKASHDGFHPMGMSSAPAMNILTALSKVRSTPYGQSSFELYLSEFDKYRDQDGHCLFQRPSTPDWLFNAEYVHPGSSCDQCDPTALVSRPPRPRIDPKVHYGLIASGDIVMKDAELRDRIVMNHGGAVLAFDMEAAALVNQCPTLVIRGICDYCDSHKNKSWQPYASAVAASWAKDFLRNVSSSKIASTASSLPMLLIEEQTTGALKAPPTGSELIKAPITRDEMQRILDCISLYEPMKVLDRIQRRRLEGTTEWLSTDEAFAKWQTGSGLLWVLGKLGSGKTILFESIIRRLLVHESQPVHVLHYFVDQPIPSAFAIVRSFTKQLLQARMSTSVCPQKVVDSLRQCFGKPNIVSDMYDLLDTILRPLLQQDTQVILCVDGYDQCREQEQIELKEFFQTLYSHHRALKVLLSSRESISLSGLKLEAQEMRIDGGRTQSAIESLIRQRLQQLSLPGRLLDGGTLRSEIEEELLGKANGMFLWVSLLLNLIEHCDTPAEVKSTISDLPQDLEQIYLRCLLRTRKGRYACDAKALRLVLVVEKPLLIEQLQDVLAMNVSGKVSALNRPAIDAVIRSAVGLLSFDHFDRSLTPIHHSIQQFIFSQSLKESITAYGLSKDSAFRQLLEPEEAARLEIAEMSLKHIQWTIAEQTSHFASFSVPNPVKGRSVLKYIGLSQTKTWEVPATSAYSPSGGTSFYSYAVETWPAHTRNINRRMSIWSLFEHVALDHKKPSNIFPWAPSLAQSYNNHMRGMLGYAVRTAHAALVELVTADKRLPKEVFDRAVSIDQMPPLHLAAATGHVAIAKLLLRKADIKHRCTIHRRTALHYAAKHGHLEMVRFLVESERSLLFVYDNRKQPALHLAAENGHLMVVSDLRQRYTSRKFYPSTVPAVPWDKHLLLRVLAKNHEKTAIFLLQERDFDFGGHQSADIYLLEGWTALMWAARWDHHDFISLLFDKNLVTSSYVEYKSVPYTYKSRTALELAIEFHARPATIRYLLRHSNVDLHQHRRLMSIAVRFQDTEMFTLLMSFQDFSLCEELIELDPDLCVPETWDWLITMSDSICEALIKSRRTLSHEAVVSCSLDLVRALLDHGSFDWTARDVRNNTPVDLASFSPELQLLFYQYQRDKPYDNPVDIEHSPCDHIDSTS